MVDFNLTDEQKDIRQLAHDFAAKEIRPVAWELDKDSTFPTEIVKQAWELGLMNSHIPEEYGGPGLDYVLTTFRRRMRDEGFTQGELDMLFVDNPRRFFAGEP